MTPDETTRWFRRAARTAAFTAITSGMLGAFEVHRRLVPEPAREALLDGYREVFLDRVLALFAVHLTVLPARPTRRDGGRLVVSNHRSALDIAVLLRLFGGHIVSRGDLAAWPLLGTVARRAGTIFVDRSEGLRRAEAARAIRRRLAAGATVTVFPEGTTFKGDEVRPFNPGVFAAAKGLDVEIVPVGLAYEPGAEYREPTFLQHLARTAERASTQVTLAIGAPMRVGDDSRAAARACHAEVQRLVHQARG